MPSRDRPTTSKLIQLERDGPQKKGGRKATYTHKLPIELNTYTRPLSRGCGYIYLGHSLGRGENWKTKAKARTRRQEKIQGRRERVANAGDRSSLVTRRATHHCLPLLHPQCYRQFSLPVWPRNPLPLLILLPPTIDRLNEDGLQATVLLVPNALVPLLKRFVAGLSLVCALAVP